MQLLSQAIVYKLSVSPQKKLNFLRLIDDRSFIAKVVNCMGIGGICPPNFSKVNALLTDGLVTTRLQETAEQWGEETLFQDGYKLSIFWFFSKKQIGLDHRSGHFSRSHARSVGMYTGCCASGRVPTLRAWKPGRVVGPKDDQGQQVSIIHTISYSFSGE